MGSAAPKHLLYLHGFRSSPRSTKARQVAEWVATHRPETDWHCPHLPPSPRDALDLALQIAARWSADDMALIGSSLGGFYATVLAERLGCRAALLNPAVEPARDLAAHLGELESYHMPGERFRFEQRHVDELQALRPAAITRPERYLAVLAKGDEVLDWREMSARYAGCPMILLEGGDHALSGFAELLPRVMAFVSGSSG